MYHDKDFVDAMELACGSGLLSYCGTTGIDRMFENINLNGKRILDFGSGIGGVDLYLAQRFNCKILGVDIEPAVLARAEKNLQSSKLKGTVEFRQCSDLTTVADRFDVIFSRDVIMHIANKENLFKDLHSLMKKDGIIIIEDWVHKTAQYSTEFAEFLQLDGLGLTLTDVQAYKKLLENAGFSDVQCQNYTSYEMADTIKILKQAKTKQFAAKLIKRFGEQYFLQYYLATWEQQIRSYQSGELLAFKFTGSR